MRRRDCVEFSVFHAIRYTTEHHIIAPSVLGEICGLGDCSTTIEALLYCVLFMICDFMSVLGRILLFDITIFSRESKILVLVWRMSCTNITINREGKSAIERGGKEGSFIEKRGDFIIKRKGEHLEIGFVCCYYFICTTQTHTLRRLQFLAPLQECALAVQMCHSFLLTQEQCK